MIEQEASFHEFRDEDAWAHEMSDAPEVERCPVCNLPDNCGDCNHYGTKFYRGDDKPD